MHVLVTGGAGFIGSSLARALLERGDEVSVIDNFNDYYDPALKERNVADLLEHKSFRLHRDDFTDKYAVDELFGVYPFDVVAHLGAMANVRYSIDHAEEFVHSNIVGTTHLLNAAVSHGVKHFVFASTSSVYGQRDDVPFKETDPTDLPLAPYPATKKAGEVLGYAYHNMHGLNFTALRFFNVYGPRGRPDMMPYKVFKALLEEREITLFDGGRLSRDWTYIDDIVQGVLAAIDRPMGYERINLGRGEPVAMTEFMEITREISGKTPKIVDVRAPASEPKITYADISKARELLGYNPETSLREGLKNFWEWLAAAD
ncbi:MAG: NAD-dependent epimerase/dehydratase family protein [Candidatus Dadabacteria bacterium]|nr:MAG: NAD-dependent epimerase/dehydratase family protein [Candidatus Dadabacteria bacterium]